MSTEEARVKITLVRSLSGRFAKHIATAHSLGLRKINDSAVHSDNDTTRGKYEQIGYLVRVEQA